MKRVTPPRLCAALAARTIVSARALHGWPVPQDVGQRSARAFPMSLRSRYAIGCLLLAAVCIAAYAPAGRREAPRFDVGAAGVESARRSSGPPESRAHYAVATQHPLATRAAVFVELLRIESRPSAIPRLSRPACAGSSPLAAWNVERPTSFPITPIGCRPVPSRSTALAISSSSTRRETS